MLRSLVIAALGLLLASSAAAQALEVEDDPRERHLRNLLQLTFGGENAEAYWSLDGKWVSLQATRGDAECDRIYVMRPDGSEARQVSSGKGRTTCAFFLDDREILYSSTVLGGWECPEKPDHSQGYVWPLDPSYDLFVRRLDGLGMRRLDKSPGYDAEATVSPDGTRIVFTSLRTGDPELFTMNVDGSGLRQLTDEVGYDGGAFFTPDNRRIVWRRSNPSPGEELEDYLRLLEQDLVQPSVMDLWVMNADGTEKREVLANGAANFAPCGLPDGTGMAFASNLHNPDGHNFDLFIIRFDGTGLEQVTFSEDFDAFPMFSPDGTQVLFSSNRFNSRRGETNVFLADWVP